MSGHVGMSPSRRSRRAVSDEAVRRIRAAVVLDGQSRTMLALRCSADVLHDALAAGGTVMVDTAERLEARALELWP